VLTQHSSALPRSLMPLVPVLSSCAHPIQEFTLGSVAPRFSTCKARYSAERSYLQLELGMDLTTAGMQAVITPKMKETGLTTRVKFSHLSIKGRVLLGLQLGSAPPGITSMNFSFVDAPEVDFQLKPLGVALTEIPGVMQYIREAFINAIQRSMVEPKRTHTDVAALFSRLRAEKQGGPGGLLVVTVLGASGLLRTSSISKAVQSPEAFCEMRASSEVFRSPTASESHSPEWSWQFECRLPAPLGAGCWSEELNFAVYDAKTVGDPQRLGGCKVKLSELHLEPNTAPVDIYMPLTSSSLSTARLHLALQLLQRSAVPVRPGPPAVATVGGVANQTQRSALIPGDTSVTWQSPKPPAPPPGADDSARVRDLTRRLEAEKSSRLAAEKQFDALTKESARLRGLLKLQSLPCGDRATPTQPQHGEGHHQHTASAHAPVGKLYEAAMRKLPASAETDAAAEQARSPLNASCPAVRGHSLPSGLPVAPAEPRRRRQTISEQSHSARPADRLGTSRSSASVGSLLTAASETEDLSDVSPVHSCGSDDGDTRGSLGRTMESTFIQHASIDLDDSLSEGSDAPLNATALPSPGSSIQLLMKISALQEKLEAERTKHVEETDAMQQNVHRLEAELASEHQRRLYEELRALAEGAKFRIHRASGIQVRHVWYSAQEKALMWRANKTDGKSNEKAESAGQGHAPSAHDAAPHSAQSVSDQVVSKLVYVKQISKIVEGTSLFPTAKKQPLFSGLLGIRALGNAAAHATAAWKDRAQEHPDPRKSFSVLFTNHAAIHLEIPHCGNGRSQAEWVSALEDLRQNRLDTDGVWGVGASPQKKRSSMKAM